MESDSQAVQTTSVLTKQPSGIRALPSNDDDSDSDLVFEPNNSPENTTESDEKSSNSITPSSETSSYSGSNGSFNGGSDNFVDSPDKETLQQPIAKVSADEDDDENGVGGDEGDDGEVGDGVGRRSYTVDSAPRVRVSGEEDLEHEDGGDGAQQEVKAESLEDKGAANDGGGDSGVGNEPLTSKIQANGVLDLKGMAVDGGGVEVSEERDAVVDSINMDVGEAVRSGTVVVRVEKEEVSEVGSAGDESVVEESAVVESKAVEMDGVKPTDEGASLEGSASVDDVEPLAPLDEELEEKKGPEVEVGTEEKAAVVGEVAEKDSENTAVEVKSSVNEEAAPVAENSVAEESAPADAKATEGDGLRVAGEQDSVVERIQVDAVEAIRSGVAVVGESGVERKETDVKETKVSVGENVALGNDFEPLAGSNASELSTDIDNHVESAGHEQNDGVRKEAKIGQTEGILDQPNSEVDLQTPDESREPEPAGGVEAFSGKEKVLQRDDIDNGPQANAAVVGEETKGDSSSANVLPDGLDAPASDKTNWDEALEQAEGIGDEAREAGDHVMEADDGDSDTDGESKDVYTSRIVEELERASREASAVDQLERIDGEVVTESEEEEEGSDEEGEEKELFDSAALAALLKAATSAGSDSGTITITSPDGSRLFSVERPAGLGSSLRAVRPASRSTNSSFLTPPNVAAPSEENLSEEEKKKLRHIHDLKVKFLRLVHRLGHAAEDSIAAQVLYRLALLAGRPTNPGFSLDSAKQTAMQLEAEGKDDLDFSLNVLVLGKTGVGKSATVNSIFGEEKVKINTFEPEKSSVEMVDGIVNGVKIRVIDAPGLRCSGMEQGFNRRVLASVKKYTKKYPPDVMLYVDRLDSPTRSLNDLPMLKTIASCLGSSIWRSAVVALTHASCAPPDGPSGSPLSYEVFVAQRSHIVQQSIGHATGDMRLMNPSLMNPVSLVENHPACRKNREGQKVLPNGQTWRPQLLLLCYSLKILSEANSASKPQDPFDHRKLFGFRARSPPLPYLLSSLLQPRAHPKLSADQGGDNGDSDIDLDDLSDSDQEEEDEYDQLPPFRPLRKSQLAMLSKDQRKAYFEEYDYRVKLLQKKQWREELKRMREMKRKGGKIGVDEYGEMPEDDDGENGAPAAVPVPLPDMVLPPTFDADNPAYRYRFLEPVSQLLVRPVLDTHGWDHDCGYDGVNVEQSLGIAGHFPAAISLQVTKDKKDFNIHWDSAVSAKHGDTGSSLVGFDIQTIGKQRAYIVRGESKFKTTKKNKTAGGISVTFLGENVATGVKVEDQISVGKRLVFVGSAGTVRSQKDAAYGANLEVRLREADYPIGQDQSSFVLSLMKWRGDLAVGGNLQSQFSVGRSTKMAVRVGLNNKLSGQISVKTSTSDSLQLALVGLVPIVVSIYRILKPSGSENYSLY